VEPVGAATDQVTEVSNAPVPVAVAVNCSPNPIVSDTAAGVTVTSATPLGEGMYPAVTVALAFTVTTQTFAAGPLHPVHASNTVVVELVAAVRVTAVPAL